MSKNNGGPAFPVAIWDKDRMTYVRDGMNLRDYFAAHIAAAAIPTVRSLKDAESIPANAYKLADALLLERDR